MIDEQILKQLVPEFDPDFEGTTKDLSVLEIEFNRRTERWCIAIQAALRSYFEGLSKASGTDTTKPDRYALIGIGFFPVPKKFSHHRQSAGLSFGVVLYNNARKAKPVEMQAIEADGQSFPVVELPVDFELDGRLGNGRCSAVLADGSDRFFLTANHCVRSIPLGNSVTVTCPANGQSESTVLVKRGHIYLDLALLRRPTKKNIGTYTKTTLVSIAARSMAVNLHNGALGQARGASVMQGIGTPSAVINGASPQTFTINIAGSKGDSGCAVSVNNALVGSYTGKLSVGTSASTSVVMGYVHCADEALRLFGCTLEEGVF